MNSTPSGITIESTMKIHDLSEFTCPFPADVLYDGKSKLEIEIGVGKGRYMRELARANPDTRLIGIEKSRTWFECAREKLEKDGAAGVLLLHSYADPILEAYLPAESVDRFHILFPDPWPKRRQQGRRIFQDWPMKLIWRALRPGGEIHFGTDHAEYFVATRRLFDDELRAHFAFTPVASLACTSNFQAKYVKEGRGLNFSIMKKIGCRVTTPALAEEIESTLRSDQAAKRAAAPRHWRTKREIG